MKHKGAVMEYSMERMNDLMRAYDEYISSCDYIRMPEVYKVIVNMPSRRFWVSDIRAALVVSAMMRGANDLSGMWPLKKEMYEEIHTRVVALKSEHPELTISELCAKVIAQPAPKFYLTPGSSRIWILKKQRYSNFVSASAILSPTSNLSLKQTFVSKGEQLSLRLH